MDPAVHDALVGRIQRMTILPENVNNQAVFALPYIQPLRGSFEDIYSLIGRKAVLPAKIPYKADAAPKSQARKGYFCNGNHNGAVLIKIPGMGPDVTLGKRPAPVPFYITVSVVKIDKGIVKKELSLQRMAHADDTVPAFHGEETKRPHNIVGQRPKLYIAQLAR